MTVFFETRILLDTDSHPLLPSSTFLPTLGIESGRRPTSVREMGTSVPSTSSIDLLCVFIAFAWLSINSVPSKSSTVKVSQTSNGTLPILA